MSNKNSLLTIGTHHRLSSKEDELNLILGCGEFDIDQALQGDEGLQLQLQSAHPGGKMESSKTNDGNWQSRSIIDAVWEDLEEDLGFDDINFDPSYEEFTDLPSLTGAYGMGMPTCQGMFNYPQFYNAALNCSVMPMFPLTRVASEIDLDLPPLSRAGKFPSNLGGGRTRRPLKKRKVNMGGFDYTCAANGRPPMIPIKESAVLDMSEVAVTAREARRIRRVARAKGQVLHLLDASVSKIEDMAILDADFNNLFDFSQTQDEQCELLLSDYMCNFDAKMFVESVWEGIYSALSTETKQNKEVDVADVAVVTNAVTDDVKSSSSVASNLINHLRKNSGLSKDTPDEVSSELSTTSSITTLKLPEIFNAPHHPDTPKSKGISHPNRIVTPTGTDVKHAKKRSIDENDVVHPMPLPFKLSNLSNYSESTTVLKMACAFESETKESKICEQYPDLPNGNDPESRRMRRLMRNRLSAQKSRDKRNNEIEVYKKLKVKKDDEIASLKKTLTEEMEALTKLEEMVSFAKSLLGPDKFATVAI